MSNPSISLQIVVQDSPRTYHLWLIAPLLLSSDLLPTLLRQLQRINASEESTIRLAAIERLIYSNCVTIRVQRTFQKAQHHPHHPPSIIIQRLIKPTTILQLYNIKPPKYFTFPRPAHDLPQTFQNGSQYCVVDNVLRRVLSTDFEVIGGTEVIEFLHIYRSALSGVEGTTAEGAERAETLRRFVMRYIADRHAAFGLRHFEEIVQSLLRLPHDKCDRFDDAAGNYPLSVFEQIKPHISKVGLFFSAETKDSLANDSRIRTI